MRKSQILLNKFIRIYIWDERNTQKMVMSQQKSVLLLKTNIIHPEGINSNYAIVIDRNIISIMNKCIWKFILIIIAFELTI